MLIASLERPALGRSMWLVVRAVLHVAQERHDEASVRLSL
jgi:hypothetical protein